MSECQVKSKNLLERLQNLLERKPNAYDVTFCVGPEKKLVRGLKVLLKAASPVFEKEFEEKWEVGIMRDEEGIPLPDFDSKVFELFIKLTLLDTWSLTTLKDLNLPLIDMLNLITICRYYEMAEGLKNLTEISVSFLRLMSVNKYHLSNDFLKLSRENLQAVLASDEISLDESELFQAAFRWAAEQCAQQGIKASKDNLRQVLDDCMYEIRFPLMTSSEFTKARKMHDMLTSEEALQIYEFIGFDETEKLGFDKSQLMYKTEPRNHMSGKVNGCKRLLLTKEFEIVGNPPFKCSGQEVQHNFVPNKNIEIHGLGFLGPIAADAEYDVTCRIYDYKHSKNMYQVSTRIRAEKGKVFFLIFNQPLMLEARELDFNISYDIYFSLKGPPTSSVQRQLDEESRLLQGGAEFFIYWRNKQLAEIIYKIL